jgi:hypothetical protein
VETEKGGLVVIRICLVIFLSLCLFGCSSFEKDTAVPERVNHLVLCWLKEPGNIEHRREIIEISRSFTHVPGVLEVRTGQVIQSDRDIVDDSFDIGIYFAFRTPEDMKKYITHPAHGDAVKHVLMPLVDKIVVYDFIESCE